DQGSGVSSAWVDVNGTRVANPSASCSIPSQAYVTRVRPCGNLNSSVALNTAQGPFHDGQNTVHICVSDLANVAQTSPNVTCQDRTLTVDNSCADSQGAQQGLATSLSGGFENPGGGGQSRALTVYSTQGAKLSGTLRNAGGGPVAGASICLYE